MDRRTSFDYTQGNSELNDIDLRPCKRESSRFYIPSCVSDVVSGFFYARSLPLQIGFSQVFPVNDGGKTTDVRIVVESREKVKGPMGEFQTLRVKAEPVSGPMTGKGEIWVWLTDVESAGVGLQCGFLFNKSICRAVGFQQHIGDHFMHGNALAGLSLPFFFVREWPQRCDSLIVTTRGVGEPCPRNRQVVGNTFI